MMSEARVFVPPDGTTSGLASVGVLALPAFRQTTPEITCGPAVVRMGRQAAMQGALRAARRFEEGDPDRIGQAVSAEYYELGTRGIHGSSDTLAAVLADRLARYGCLLDLNGLGRIDLQRRIVATGRLGEDGRVDRIGSFCTKLALIAEGLDEGRLAPGDLFIFPAENEQNPDANEVGCAPAALLGRLRERGLICQGIGQLSTRLPRPLRWCVRIGLLRRTYLTVAALLAGASTAAAGILCEPFAHTPDVEVTFTYGGEDGREMVLESGSRLHSGTLIAIQLAVHRPVYVYIVHIDSRGTRTELLRWSGYHNWVQPGVVVSVPPSHQAFKLDDHPGTEVFHTIVSDVRLAIDPLLGTGASARRALDAIPQAIATTLNRRTIGGNRGILVSTTETAGKLETGLEGGTCRQSFTIEHLP